MSNFNALEPHFHEWTLICDFHIIAGEVENIFYLKLL